jgi:hypothetical protein
MKRTKIFPHVAALLFLGTAVAVHAASITGTVTNKTTNRPSAGDTVVLVDVQAGMNEAASATTDGSGQYSIDAPGMGPYLIRVTHQGAAYFIAAPQGGAAGNVTVYDVAAKVGGVAIDADMYLVEAAGGMMRVHERFLVRNTSFPETQFSNNTFEIVLPDDAEIDSASATRPGGLGTNTHLTPLSEKGHYTFNIPIQPDQDEKETLFEVQYHLAYNGKYTFHPRLQMPADSLVVYAAQGIDFKPAEGSIFQSAQEDPRVQTFRAKNVHPGQAIAFAISGEGQMPADAQSAGMAPQGGMDTGPGGGNGITNGPGGGLGPPIGSPDPLSKYKWWILTTLALFLVVAAGFLLRRRAEAIDSGVGTAFRLDAEAPPAPTLPQAKPNPDTRTAAHATQSANSNDALLNLIKEEMFAIEREKLSGSLPLEEYTPIKAGLDALLRRALRAHESPTMPSPVTSESHDTQR